MDLKTFSHADFEASAGKAASLLRTLSQHLAVLREAGIVETRREAQTIHYRIADPAAVKVVETLAAIFCPEKPTPLRKKS
jgi:ArsR family transcriptional regulator